MDNANNILNIKNISDGTSFWMIRTKRDCFFDEFIKEGYVAIGWNAVTDSVMNPRTNSDLDYFCEDRLKEIIKSNYNETRLGLAVNKCLRFREEMKDGDIAVIVDGYKVAFAVIGEYYEESPQKYTVEYEKEIINKIDSTNTSKDKIKCPYIKRRKISLIKKLTEDDTISPYLKSVIAGNKHSLCILNSYADTILCCCYDAFIYKNKITVTFRVEQKNDINAVDLSNFVLSAAKILSCGKPENVSVKTALHSPGEIIMQIANDPVSLILLLMLIYFMVFGGKYGDMEFNSLYCIFEKIIKSNSKYQKQREALELKKLKAEVKLAEENAESKKLNNIEKAEKLHCLFKDDDFDQMRKAAENLDIRLDRSTIIEMTNFIEKYKDEK